ncbi:MAG: hypothetical protein PHR94_07045 [Methylomonas lenta]|nr:hypothetical protein [Methylomonas lenta]
MNGVFRKGIPALAKNAMHPCIAPAGNSVQTLRCSARQKGINPVARRKVVDGFISLNGLLWDAANVGIRVRRDDVYCIVLRIILLNLRTHRKMLHCLYQLIKDFQSLIVGIVGFSGVIITLFMNARLLRLQHQRNVDHERNTLKIALISELTLNQRVFSDKSEVSENNQEEIGAYYPIEAHTKIYQNFLGKLGLLSEEEAEVVVNAYTLIQELPIRLTFLSSPHDQSFEKQNYIFISSQFSSAAAGIYKSFLPSIETALNKLRD